MFPDRTAGGGGDVPSRARPCDRSQDRTRCARGARGSEPMAHFRNVPERVARAALSAA